MSTALTHIETKKQRVPALRFEEFDGDWNEILLDDFAQRGSGHTPSKSYPEYYNGDINWISLTDSKRLDNGFIDETNSTITQKGIDNSSAVLHPAGTVLLSRDAGVGKSAVMKHSMAVSQHFIVWKTQEDKSSNWFLYNWLQIMKPHFERMAVGNTIKTIGLPYFKKLKIVTPQFPEQQKIASFLSAVDEKTQQLTKKKALLEQYKKGVMQQLFSGQLRFKDENGNPYPDWKEKALGEAMEMPKKVKPTSFDVNKLLTVKLHTKGLFKNERTESLKLGATNYFVRNEGQFIYGKQNLFNGAFGIIPKKFDGFYSSSDIPALDFIKGKVVPKFVLFYLSRKSYYDRLESIASGSGSKRIHETIFLEIEINFPSIQEQKKIATYLSRIDTKIEAVNNQITQTQTFKKGLLQQMFVAA
jgi:type I restriction enzyme S subunit